MPDAVVARVRSKAVGGDGAAPGGHVTAECQAVPRCIAAVSAALTYEQLVVAPWLILF